MRAVVAIFIALPFVSALSGVVTKGSEVNNQTFDYIIIGGGLGGFTVAGRLSEDPNVKVLVIEAGRDTRTDEIVSNAYNYGKNFNQEEYPDIWWNWPTENGHGLMGGRGLGGSTSVNGMTFTRGQKAQYDALGELLGGNTNDGKWSWDGMLAAMKKSEHYSAPNEEQRARGAGFNADVHGSLGPVQVTFPNQMYDKQARAFHDVCAGNFSIPHSDDAADGSAAVVSWFPNVSS
jgi:choline dehydrogenase-like flavoprotein